MDVIQRVSDVGGGDVFPLWSQGRQDNISRAGHSGDIEGQRLPEVRMMGILRGIGCNVVDV